MFNKVCTFCTFSRILGHLMFNTQIDNMGLVSNNEPKDQ